MISRPSGRHTAPACVRGTAPRRSGINLYATNVTGTGGEKRLKIWTASDSDELVARPTFLLFQRPPRRRHQGPLARRRAGVVAGHMRFEGSAQFSPDGRWVAYSSDETGRPEVYVVPFPKGPASVWRSRPTSGGSPPIAARQQGTVPPPRRQHADGSRRQSEGSVRGRRSGQPAVPVAV